MLPRHWVHVGLYVRRAAICYSDPDLSPINMLHCSSGLLSHSLAPGLRSCDVQLGDLQLADLIRM